MSQLKQLARFLIILAMEFNSAFDVEGLWIPRIGSEYRISFPLSVVQPIRFIVAYHFHFTTGRRVTDNTWWVYKIYGYEYS